MYVRISDYTKYKAETCNNGGDYAFYTTFYRIEGDKYEVVYSNSASSDFVYCNACGSFYSDSECSCGGENKIVTSIEVNAIMQEIIKKITDGKDFNITIG